LLIETDYATLFSIGQINLFREGHNLHLQKTKLGWMVAGSAPLQSSLIPANCCLTNLEKQLINSGKSRKLQIDFRLKKKNNVKSISWKMFFRDTDGRYTVHLPFRMMDRYLGESRATAFKCFVLVKA